jgi:hypothetical protein
MLLPKFDAPGFLKDLNEQQQKDWSKWLSRVFDAARVRGAEDGICRQFYNPTKVETDADAKTKDIFWTAFPRIVQLDSSSDLQRWKRADADRDVQDEYCEWSVERDDSGKITRVTFTCEGPEYWEFLAEAAPDKVVELYSKFVSPEVKKEDLFTAADVYDPRNKWNSSTTNGAMHLIQRNNTLTAEIILAAGATVVRKHSDGTIATEEQELIECGRYGEPSRHSDPHIGAEVNELARLKADITLENPVGLYFGGLNTSGWETPDGTPAQDFWKYVRGTGEKPVRAVLEVPPELNLGYVVGDIKIQGRNINFGAQVTDFISMKLTGTATRFDKSAAEPRLCLSELEADEIPASDFGEDLFKDVIISSRRSSD